MKRMKALDFKKYPQMVQLLPRYMFGIRDGGISSIDIGLDSREITIRKLKKIHSINERIYEIDDNAFQKLLEFFTIDAIESFNAVPENDLMDKWDGYRDEGYHIDYRIFFNDHDPPYVDGTLTWIFKDNPMEKLLYWLREFALPNVGDASI